MVKKYNSSGYGSIGGGDAAKSYIDVLYNVNLSANNKYGTDNYANFSKI